MPRVFAISQNLSIWPAHLHKVALIKHLYAHPSRRISAPSKSRRLCGVAGLVLSLTFSSACSASPQDEHSENPMQDKYSQLIRAEYAKCREEKNPMSQFFCSCRLLEQQCEAPRRPEHGDWNTVEFWPSNDESQREVQFILFMDYDILGDFSPMNKGVVLTCMAGISELTVFVGDNVNPDVRPFVTIHETEVQASFVNEEGAYMLEFGNTPKVYSALETGEEMLISYTDMEDIPRSLEFNTYGFASVSKGWETLCTGKPS